VATVTAAQVDCDAAEAGGERSDLADVELEEGAAADDAKHGPDSTGPPQWARANGNGALRENAKCRGARRAT
jgi:hypothetical protein